MFLSNKFSNFIPVVCFLHFHVHPTGWRKSSGLVTGSTAGIIGYFHWIYVFIGHYIAPSALYHSKYWSVRSYNGPYLSWRREATIFRRDKNQSHFFFSRLINILVHIKQLAALSPMFERYYCTSPTNNSSVDYYFFLNKSWNCEISWYERIAKRNILTRYRWKEWEEMWQGCVAYVTLEMIAGIPLDFHASYTSSLYVLISK